MTTLSAADLTKLHHSPRCPAQWRCHLPLRGQRGANHQSYATSEERDADVAAHFEVYSGTEAEIIATLDAAPSIDVEAAWRAFDAANRRGAWEDPGERDAFIAAEYARLTESAPQRETCPPCARGEHGLCVGGTSGCPWACDVCAAHAKTAREWRAAQPAAPETERLWGMAREVVDGHRRQDDGTCRECGQGHPCHAWTLAYEILHPLAQPAAPETERLREAAAEMVQAYVDAEAGNEFNARMEAAWKALRAAIEAGDGS